MTWPFASVDIALQRVRLTSNVLTGAAEAWFTDLFSRGLSTLGLVDISFEANAPTNIRKLWFDAGVPVGGAPGILKKYDSDLDAWIKITPTGFISFLSIAGRPIVWKTSTLAVGLTRPPDNEVLFGDLWEHDTGTDNELSIWRDLGVGNQAWVDLTGGYFDQSVINSATRTATISQTLQHTTTATYPSGEFYGQKLYDSINGRWSIWSPAPDRWHPLM